MIYGGGVPWPLDNLFHTLEIRMSNTSASRTSRSRLFEGYFDGLPVAKNISGSGPSGSEYQVGITASTDALNNPYSFEVENCKVYRQARRR